LSTETITISSIFPTSKVSKHTSRHPTTGSHLSGRQECQQYYYYSTSGPVAENKPTVSRKDQGQAARSEVIQKKQLKTTLVRMVDYPDRCAKAASRCQTMLVQVTFELTKRALA
jgi:hypothetical protein